MREIVAYAPVEPDGSVRMKVPANIAFHISILDANGRRVSPLHRTWLSVRPGEVLECTGCHARTGPVATQTSHGRSGSFNAAYQGATATGAASASASETVCCSSSRTTETELAIASSTRLSSDSITPSGL